MPDERFKRYQDAGSDFLESARARAEEFLRELAKATESTQKQASDQVDDLVAAGRKSTDQILDVIRREISTQLSQLGLVTQQDLNALERRILSRVDTAKKAPAKKAPAAKAPASRAPAAKATPAAATATKATTARTTTAKATTTKKSPAKKAPAKKAGGASSSR